VLKELNLIVKIAGSCNLECTYCYAAQYTRHLSEAVMSIETFERLLHSLAEFPAENSKIILHGGEPLIVGQRFLEQICALRNQLGVPVAPFAMQTNGTLITPALAEFFRSHSIGIGVSLDGPPALQDHQRPLKSGRGSYERVLRGIQRLRAVGMKPMIACVVTQDSLSQAEAIYDHFIQNGITSFDFLPCFELDPHTERIYDSAVSPYDFGIFMIEIFDRWWRDDDPDVHVRLIDNVMAGLMGGRPRLCQFSGTCGLFMSVNYNGDVYPCDLFIGLPEFCLGNIHERSLFELWKSEVLVQFRAQVSSVRPMCRDCEWLSACRGGCSMHWYLGGGDLVSINRYCESRQMVFAHIRDTLRQFVA